MDTIYGKNAVFEALKSKRKVYEMIIQDGFRDENFIQLARKNNAKITTKTRKEMDKIADKHQGVILIVEGYSYKNLDYILSNIKNKYPFIILLEGIEDPHNLGAVLRSCDAAGVDGIVITKHNSVKINSTVAKVSTGAIEHVNVVQAVNLRNVIDKLKKEGFLIVGSDSEGSKKYNEINYKCPLALIIGSEGNGLRQLTKKLCDELVNIPMKGKVNSLNASVAAGILMFEVNRQRD